MPNRHGQGMLRLPKQASLLVKLVQNGHFPIHFRKVLFCKLQIRKMGLVWKSMLSGH